MLNTLCTITEKLNEERIVWGIGGSVMLNHYGLDEQPNDIDILIDLKDIKSANLILSRLGEKKAWEKAEVYSTRHFYEYVINGVDVDVISGLTINHSEGAYIYEFDERSIAEVIRIKDNDVPLTSLEDWFVIYQLIPNREPKVKMVEEYLLSHGVKRADLLQRALKGTLPDEVKARVEKLLESRLNSTMLSNQ
jgi:hypothetical protein